MKSLRVIALALVLSAAYSVQQGEAGRPVCYGTCTVECAEGTYTYYHTAAHRCCEKEEMCPGATVTWFPEYSWECSEAFGFICPFEPLW